MATAFVQAAGSGSSSNPVTVIAATFGAAVAEGNCVVGMVHFHDPGVLEWIRDDKGNAYHVIGEVAFSTSHAILFYCAPVGSEPTIITAQLSTGATWIAIQVQEVSGVDPVRAIDVVALVSQSNIGAGTDAATSGAATTAEDGAYIFGAIGRYDAYSPSPIWAAGTSFTERLEIGDASVVPSGATEGLVQATAGSIAATFTTTASLPDAYVGMVALRELVGAGTGGDLWDDRWRSGRSYHCAGEGSSGMMQNPEYNESAKDGGLHDNTGEDFYTRRVT